MAIDIIRVTEKIRPQFEKYCLEFGPEHDSSFIQGRDLSLSEDHPSYVVMDDGELVGAVSLMRTENLLSIGKGRFSIFHSRTGKAEVYAGLFDAIRPHTEDLRSVYLFLP